MRRATSTLVEGIDRLGQRPDPDRVDAVAVVDRTPVGASV